MAARRSAQLAQAESISMEPEPAHAVRTIASTLVVLVAYVVTLLALAAFAFTDVASPSSGRLHCGQVVKRNVQLHHDVTGCRYDGLVAGRSGITIDLNGHTVGAIGGDVGIRVAGVRRVRVLNGTVRGFQVGVSMAGADRSRIARVNTGSNTDVGLQVTGSNNNRFRRITASGNSDAGILLEHSNRNRLYRIRAIGNGDAGIRIWSSHRNRLRASRVFSSSDSGIGLQDASGNLVARNTIMRNAEGITVDGGAGNRILRNTSNRNGGRGIEVSAEAQRTRVGHNRANLNLSDGIYVEGAGTAVRHNSADCNGGMGIKAVAAFAGCGPKER